MANFGTIFPFVSGSLFGNIGLAVLLNLIIKSLWILANSEVQDQIGKEDFGTFSALFALGFLFMALTDMGVSQYTTKTLAGNPGRLRELFPGLFALKLMLSVAFPGIMVGIAWLFGYRGNELLYVFILSGVHAFLQLITFFRAGFQAFQFFRLDAYASVLDRALLLGIIGVLLVTGITLESYVLAFAVSAGVTVVLLYLLAARLWGWLTPKLGARTGASLLRAALPFAFIMTLNSVHDKVDQVMLERISGDGETGLYAGAYRWVDAFMMYLWTVLPIFFARFAKYAYDFPAQTRLLAFGQSIAALPVIFVSVFVLFYGDKLFWLIEDGTEEMTVMLRILAVAMLINCVFAIYSTLLTSTGHENFVSLMILLSILLNTVLNFIFIPQYGGIAASWNTVVSYAFLSSSYLVYFLVKLPQVKIPWLVMGKVMLAGGVYAGIFYALHLTELPWYAVTAFAGVALAALSWLLGLIRMKEQV